MTTGNASTWQPGTVTLIDGREVPSDSEEWRAECEARHILNMPSKADRRDFVYGPIGQDGIRRGGVARKRGMEAAQRLEESVRRLHSIMRARQQKNLQQTG